MIQAYDLSGTGVRHKWYRRTTQVVRYGINYISDKIKNIPTIYLIYRDILMKMRPNFNSYISSYQFKLH